MNTADIQAGALKALLADFSRWERAAEHEVRYADELAPWVESVRIVQQAVVYESHDYPLVCIQPEQLHLPPDLLDELDDLVGAELGEAIREWDWFHLDYEPPEPTDHAHDAQLVEHVGGSGRPDEETQGSSPWRAIDVEMASARDLVATVGGHTVQDLVQRPDPASLAGKIESGTGATIEELHTLLARGRPSAADQALRARLAHTIWVLRRRKVKRKDLADALGCNGDTIRELQLRGAPQ